jgi:integrase
MRDKPISDLRRRMIAEMTVRTFKRQDAARLYPACRDLRQISRPLARHRDQRRYPPLSAFAGRAGRAAAEAALSIAYGAGLRGGEIVMLRLGDICWQAA